MTRPVLSIVPTEPATAAGHGEPPRPPGPPETGMPVWLVVLRGPQIGRRFRLGPGRTTLGGAAECTLQIDGDDIADTHAAIEYDGEALGIESLGSDGVTHVNDARVQRALLHHNDTLTLGRVELRVLIHPNAEEAYHEQLYLLSTTDALTQVANRRFAYALLDKSLEEARQTDTALSLIACNLDHFRRFNEDAGHRTGDCILREVAALLRQQVRDGDVVARVRGDEFVVIMRKAELGDAERIAERIRRGVEAAELAVDGRRFPQTFSLGVATLRDSDEGRDELLQRVDELLMSAKRGGRNRVVTQGVAATG